MRILQSIFVALLLSVPMLAQETVDHSGAASVIPFPYRDSSPGACRPGSFHTRSDGTVGSNVYVCGTSSNWVAIGAVSAAASINIQTGTTYTLVAADNGKVITLNNASAITLTVPASLGAGFNCLIVQLGAGQVTPTASSTTLHNRQSFTKTAGQYAVATLLAYVADTFVLGGDLQ